jgi:DnaJ-class molecular chaperone
MPWARATCPRCGGAGRVSMRVVKRGFFSDSYVWQDYACPACNGAGVVSVQIAAAPSNFASSFAGNVAAGVVVAAAAPACAVM